MGISGSKVGLSAWDNPVTMMKTVHDDVESLEEVFRVLEGCTKGDLKKEELVRIGMTKKKELRAWKDGGFQARFMSTAAKLWTAPLRPGCSNPTILRFSVLKPFSAGNEEHFWSAFSVATWGSCEAMLTRVDSFGRSYVLVLQRAYVVNGSPCFPLHQGQWPEN